MHGQQNVKIHGLVFIPETECVYCTVRTESLYTDMCRLTTGIRFEKYVVRGFRRCANVMQCTDTNLDIIAYCTTRLYAIA